MSTHSKCRRFGIFGPNVFLASYVADPFFDSMSRILTWVVKANLVTVLSDRPLSIALIFLSFHNCRPSCHVTQSSCIYMCCWQDKLRVSLHGFLNTVGVKGTAALKSISPTEFETAHSESVSALSESSGVIKAVSQNRTVQCSVSVSVSDQTRQEVWLYICNQITC